MRLPMPKQTVFRPDHRENEALMQRLIETGQINEMFQPMKSISREKVNRMEVDYIQKKFNIKEPYYRDKEDKARTLFQNPS